MTFMPTSLAGGSYVVKGLFTEVLLPTLPPKRGFTSLQLSLRFVYSTMLVDTIPWMYNAN